MRPLEMTHSQLSAANGKKPRTLEYRFLFQQPCATFQKVKKVNSTCRWVILPFFRADNSTCEERETLLVGISEEPKRRGFLLLGSSPYPVTLDSSRKAVSMRDISSFGTAFNTLALGFFKALPNSWAVAYVVSDTSVRFCAEIDPHWHVHHFLKARHLSSYQRYGRRYDTTC